MIAIFRTNPRGATRLAVQFRDGRAPAELLLCHPQGQPIPETTDAMIVRKFRLLTEGLISAARRDRIEQLVLGLGHDRGGDVGDLIEPARLAEPRVRRHDDSKLGREAGEKRKPHHRFAESAVQIDKRLPVAAARNDGRLAGDIDGFGLPAAFVQVNASAVVHLFDEVEHFFLVLSPEC